MFAFDNTYVRDLTGAYAAVAPETPPAPRLVALNRPLAEELGLDPDALEREGAELLSGARLPSGAEPIAQAYAGHQFGGLSPQLGDGRAHLLGEIVDRHGRRRDLQLKGSGRTPFSRRGDGKAALGPMLREYLIGEAMHHLGIPTTRALAVTATGEEVLREMARPGAVLARIAASHLRVGTFEFFALRGDRESLRRLLDYTIERHYPGADRTAVGLLTAVRDAQAALVAEWMGVGFIHGVMNTDNVALSGETIDYGPCAFMDSHHPGTVFSSIDGHGRYAYGNQPAILGWNLARFASALLPVVHDDPEEAVAMAQPVIDGYEAVYRAAQLAVMRRKLGLGSVRAEDETLVDELLRLMADARPDHTGAFRGLADVARGDRDRWTSWFDDRDRAETWVRRWLERLGEDGAPPERAEALERANPVYVARNHQVERALAAASDEGDFGPFHALVSVLTDPFTRRPGLKAYESPAPASFTADYRTFCGT